MAERVWVDVNSRVNYPIKACLRDMQEAGEINMEGGSAHLGLPHMLLTLARYHW